MTDPQFHELMTTIQYIAGAIVFLGVMLGVMYIAFSINP